MNQTFPIRIFRSFENKFWRNFSRREKLFRKLRKVKKHIYLQWHCSRTTWHEYSTEFSCFHLMAMDELLSCQGWFTIASHSLPQVAKPNLHESREQYMSFRNILCNIHRRHAHFLLVRTVNGRLKHFRPPCGRFTVFCNICAFTDLLVNNVCKFY